MSLEVCANLCFNHTDFGVVAGTQCWCGDTIAGSATTTAAQACFSNAVACPGNANELCGGGGSAMPIYGQVTRSGACPAGTSVWSTVGCSTVTARRNQQTTGPGNWKVKRDMFDAWYEDQQEMLGAEINAVAPAPLAT